MAAVQLPIGVFDSGVGGLTILQALEARLPHEHYLYLGDTAHVPYGDKSAETVQAYALEITEFLLNQGIKALVVACNTASAVAYPKVHALCAAHGVPAFEVIGPTVGLAYQLSAQKRIGVIGTRTTIQSGVYGKRLEALAAMQGQPVQVLQKATPLLVPMIEEGWYQHAVRREVIDAYMSDTGFAAIDTLILGCTHYPLIQAEVEQYFAQEHQAVQVLSSSAATAEAVALTLHELGLLLQAPVAGAQSRFWLSDVTQAFKETASRFLGRDVQLLKAELSA